MSSISTIGQNTFINSQILNLESQIDGLSNQISSGTKAQTFSGINAVSQLSLQLTNADTTTQGYLTNINNAQTLTAPMQSVLQQVTDIVNQLRTDALTASSDSLPVTQGNGALAAEAQDALNQISALLNTKVGNTYLFGGQNTTTPPLPNFGSISNAGSTVGQVAALSSSTALNGSSQSGDALYDAIQSFLNSGMTKTTSTGATAPSAFGYTGQTGEPGGSDYRFTLASAATQGATQVTVSQGFDLPTVGQYVEFGTVPPMNTAYQVTAVNTATRQITFQSVPGTFTGLDQAIPAGTSVNVTTRAAVTTVASPGANTTDTLVPSTSGLAAVGATSIKVASIGLFSTGQQIQFSNDLTNTYTVTGVDPTNGAINVKVNATATSDPLTATAPAGSTSLQVTTPTLYKVGSTLNFAGDTSNYVVSSISGNTVNFAKQPSPPGGGLNFTETFPVSVQVTPPPSGLVNAAPAGTTIAQLPSGFSPLSVGATQIPVGNPSLYKVGDVIQASGSTGNYYEVTGVNTTTGMINIKGFPGGGGLAASIDPNTESLTIIQGYAPGTNVIPLASVSGVTAGMSVKFSNSNITYTVANVDTVNNTIQVVPLGTSQGPGIEEGLPGPVSAIAGGQVTASFGAAIQPLSVQIDNGVSLNYGIPADAHAFRQVLGAIFALATTTLNTTTQGGFRQIAARAAADLQSGSTEITGLAATLGVKQQTLTATQTRLQDFQTTLKTQLSNLNDVDMTSAVSKLTQTQTQLQASFQLLATLKNLTLANYL
jgi:flagellin-like hook-associated protein FlgL